MGRLDLIVDLVCVGFIDSVGLGTLVGAFKAARQAGGDMALRAPPLAVSKLLDITGLTKVLRVLD